QVSNARSCFFSAMSLLLRPGRSGWGMGGGRKRCITLVPAASEASPPRRGIASPRRFQPPGRPADRPLKSARRRADAIRRYPDMQSHFVSLFLQYARLDRKRTLEGLSTDEAARLAELEATISRALLPHVPRGAERRNSIRVPAELACRWAPVACEEEARITTISRTGAFIRTARPAPHRAAIAI